MPRSCSAGREASSSPSDAGSGTTALPIARTQTFAIWLSRRSTRGYGLGQRILDRLIEEARESAIEQLTLDARGDNLAAHSLWRSRGFVEYGRLSDFVAVGDARYDKTFWVLDLRAKVVAELTETTETT